jgi:DNA topoisomerase VI subunit B
MHAQTHDTDTKQKHKHTKPNANTKHKTQTKNTLTHTHSVTIGGEFSKFKRHTINYLREMAVITPYARFVRALPLPGAIPRILCCNLP